MLSQVGWDDMRGFLSAGGTLIGTARCAAFRETKGRRAAVLNLVKHGIDALVVCGGDGSLTGADRLRAEWPEHMAALLASGSSDLRSQTSRLMERRRRDEGAVREQQAPQHRRTRGLDRQRHGGDRHDDWFALSCPACADFSGATTALHRICEAVDSISSTASSHSRAFIIEVMGRNCGWLALMAAISTGADYMFIPERPPTAEDWKSSMCSVLERVRLPPCLL